MRKREIVESGQAISMLIAAIGDITLVKKAGNFSEKIYKINIEIYFKL